MTEANKSPKSSKLIPILAGVGVAVVAIVAIAGFAVYNYIIVPAQITDTANKNVDLINHSFNQSKTEYNSLSTKLSGDGKNMGSQEQVVAALKDSSSNLSKLEETIKNDKSSLIDGQNADTKKLADAGREMLDQAAGVASSMKAAVDHQVCLVQAGGEFAAKFEASQKLLTQDTGNDSAKLTGNIDQASVQIDDGVKALSALKGCFTGNLASELTPGLSKAIDDDSKLYNDLNSALKQLSSAVKNNSLDQVNAANAKIMEITKKDSSLDKNPEFNKLMNAPAAKVDQSLKDLDASYNKFDQVYKEVRDKYGLKLEK